MLDYIRDGQAIYRASFGTIRAEANLAAIPVDLEKLAVRVIHACGMTDVIDDLVVGNRILYDQDVAALLTNAQPVFAG